MIKTLFLSALLSISLYAKNYLVFAKEMNYESDYKIALQKAKKENKQIMLFMTANFCPWCLKFEKKVLTKDIINKKIQEKYVPLILNREKGNFPNIFNTPITPTAYFIDPKTQTIKEKVVGYHNRNKFIEIVEK